jgi:AAT family amino acid transporter/D-serine/D-alanine/glycine transporter
VNACAIVLLIGVALNYMIPDRIFGYFVACVSALLMWTWAVIMLCHLAYRRRVLRGEARQVGFHLPAAPYSNWLVLAFIGVVGALLALNSGSRAAYYSAGCWFAFLFLADAVAARVRARAVQGARAP